MKTKYSLLLTFCQLMMLTSLRAQLVDDGATNVLSHVTNIVPNVIVGTNGAFTLLVVSNNALLNNSTVGIIGRNATAQSNEVRVTGTNARWSIGSFGSLYVGSNGPANRLSISDGGAMQGFFFGNVGQNTSSSNNSILVTDPGSICSGFLLFMGGGGGNQLIVSNGATVWTGGGNVGLGSASNNLVIVTGQGSIWTNDAGLTLGSIGNRVIVSAGGRLANGGATVGLDATANNNFVLITDPGSSWTNSGLLSIGQGGSRNQLTVSNGALVHVGSTAGVGFDSGANSNSILVTDPGSTYVVNGNFLVGSNGVSGLLIVSNGASVNCGMNGVLGYNAGANNNFALVTGANSCWSNRFNVNVGLFGATNRMRVELGGKVVNDAGYVGGFSGNNEVVVSDPGSLWWNMAELVVGDGGARNRMVVTNGGVVVSDLGDIGVTSPAGSNNTVLVTGAGSLWTNATALSVGHFTVGNQLVVSNAGAVLTPEAIIVGVGANSTGNRITVDGGLMIVTNVTANGLLEVRRGTNVLNAGLVEADVLRMTNGIQGRFEVNGGTLSVKSSRVSVGNPIFVGNGTTPGTFNLAGNGTHDFSGTLGLIVSSNSTLTGNGSLIVQLQVLNGARFIPGASIGKISLSTPPFLFGTVAMEISKTGVVLTNDRVEVTGTLTYGGSLVVSNLGPTALASGDSFKLFDASGYAGAFTNITLPLLAAGLDWTNKLLVDGSIAVIGSVATREFGVDVSHFQGESGISQVGWNQMFAGGKRFAFVKATEGLSVLDGAMPNNMERATAAGLRAGVYHFAHPELRPTPDGAAQEADYLLTYAGNFVGPGYLRPVLDLETGSGLSTSELTDWVIAFANEIIANRGVGAAPIVYCTQSYANNELDGRLKAYDLWLRTISALDPATSEPPGQGFANPTGVFDNWSFWQYSGSGSAGGISPIDLNVCHGDFKVLDAFLIPAVTNPVAPTIAIQPQDRTVTVSNNASFSVTVSVASSTPLFYQWRMDGTNISGANASALTLTNVQFAAAGSYAVVITNAGGSITSQVATLTVNAPVIFQGIVLYEENFDSYPTPSVVTEPGVSNGFKLFYGAANAGFDFTAAFGADYSGVTSPTTVPSAPYSTNGTTKGLFITVNKDATGAAAALNLYPVSQVFTGSVALKCDVWINYPNTSTATEHALFGINHSGNVTNRVSQATSDGLFFAMSSDGMVTSGSATLRDFAVFRGRGAGATPELLTTANTFFGPEPLLGVNFDNADAGFAALFPAQTLPSFTTLAGAAGNRWVSVEVRQQTNLVTWLLNNVVVAQYVNTNAFTNGDIMIGYNDAFNSIGGIDNFVLFDNLRVETAVPDYDHDGLPDQWEVQFFGNLAADPNVDLDGDGINNSGEFQSGTNPTNALSALKLIGAARNGNDVGLTWSTVGGHNYVVQHAGSPELNFTDLSGRISVGGLAEGTTNYTHVGGATTGAGYYRIRLGP